MGDGLVIAQPAQPQIIPRPLFILDVQLNRFHYAIETFQRIFGYDDVGIVGHASFVMEQAGVI